MHIKTRHVFSKCVPDELAHTQCNRHPRQLHYNIFATLLVSGKHLLQMIFVTKDI